MDLSGATVYRLKLTFDLKNSNLAILGFINTFPPKSTEAESSFGKLNSLPTKLSMLFPTHLYRPGSCVHKPTPFHCPKMEPNYTHSL